MEGACSRDTVFRERVVRVREILENFEPHTLDPILEILESGEVRVEGEVEP